MKCNPPGSDWLIKRVNVFHSNYWNFELVAVIRCLALVELLDTGMYQPDVSHVIISA